MLSGDMAGLCVAFVFVHLIEFSCEESSAVTRL